MSNITTVELKGYFYALLSAFLFGASTPISKHLLKIIDPWLLAGIIYISAALGLLITLLLRQLISGVKITLALKPGAWKWVLGSTLLGGVIGPVLLLSGLAKINASTTALFLNFENVFTVILAVTIFKEKVSRLTALGILLIILGGFELTWNKELKFNHLSELLLIIAACLAWAIDNNFVKKIATEDPVILSLIKCLMAGVTNTILGLMVSENILFEPNVFVKAGMVGIVCYAWSLVLFILALRYIGAARTAAYYSLAPFIGTSFSIFFLKETISMQLTLASIFIGGGVFLHIISVLSKVAYNNKII